VGVAVRRPLLLTVLESLYQHRLLSTVQIHALHMPHNRLHWTQRVLGRLRANGLVRSVSSPTALRNWLLTERGADAVEVTTNRAELRRKLLTVEQATGQLQAHTLAVNDVGIAFVTAARQRGDECGPFAWRHEIAHPIGPAPGRRGVEQLIADALLIYQQVEPSAFHYRFVELDRATSSVPDLAAKLVRYARLYRYVAPRTGDGRQPLWTRMYPVFPTVLVALSGAERAALVRRRESVLALCARNRELRASPQVQIAMCLLEDLVEHGPFAAIFRTLADPETPVDWLGNAEVDEARP
jgi:Replication-relaxation